MKDNRASLRSARRLLAAAAALVGIVAGGLMGVGAAPADLDLTFDGDGKVTTDFGGADAPDDLAAQPDGKIVVVGTSAGDFALARYHANGTLDTSFGSGGKVTTDLGSGDDSIHAVALQPDGKIVVAGQTSVGGDVVFAVARYTAAGALDSGFGSAGIVTTDLGGPDVALDVLIQPDGKILVSGRGGDDFGLARYNANGTPDPSFGTAGKLLTDINGEVDTATQVALQSDGKIVAVGFGNVGGQNRWALARYSSTGTLDPTFGTGGKVSVAGSGGGDVLRGLILQGDGKIVVGGYVSGSNTDVAIARFTAAGVLDATFGAGGKTLTDFGGNEDVFGLAMQSDGKFVVGGYTSAGVCCDFLVARYTPSGSLDLTFGMGGKVTTDFGGVEAHGRVVLQPDGKIVQTGYSIVAGNQNFAVARYQGTPTGPAMVFTGFFPPVDNSPTVNRTNAGRSVPIKFSLGGNHGLDIFAAGYPVSQQINCSTNAPIDVVEETVTAGQSSLSYDATTDRYTYVWKTESSWAGTCRRFTIRLKDGTEHEALFDFTR